ncbi:MAG TPA: lipopolysaccharide heptosyltransferase I [Methylomirabilota bacterium]|nr:lipopolysaccharide heptosyltransferase I [Methylomirabilota bacterium]
MAADGPRIALVKLSSLGDVIHALPVAASLRAARPAARLTWIVERREAAVLRDHPALDEIVVADTRGWRRARRPAAVRVALGQALALRRRLAATRFDVALDLQGLVKSGVIAAATRAPLRIGFAAGVGREPLSALFTNRRVVPPPAARHVVEQYLALLEPLGVVERRLEFRLPVTPAAETAIDEWLAAADLKPHGRLVLLNPGAGRPDKRWPPEHFAALARGLVRDADARVVVTWGPGEDGIARAIAAAAPVTLAPPTDLQALPALLRRASVVVAADTGPLHLAAAAGTPCVGLYGPTSAVRNGPYGTGHRALASPDGTMAALAPPAVLAAVVEALG